MAVVPSIGRASRVEHRVGPADEAAQLYERYSVQIFGYCLRQLGSREEAEDAAQTTFMNAFRGLARGIVPHVEQAWLFKIAHNVCLSRRRSSWRRGRVEAPNNMEVLQEVVPAKEKGAEELMRLQDVLGEMSESQRRAILLREWQGLSYREIAEELGLSQAAVETLIFRARRALAAGLEEAPADGSWRRRARRGADVGSVLAFVKTLLGGGGAAAVKVASLVALAGAAVATTAVGHGRPQHRAAAAASASRSAAGFVPTVVAAPASESAAVDRPTTSAPPKPTRVIAPRRSASAPTPKITASTVPQRAPAPTRQATADVATTAVQTSEPAPAKQVPPKQSGSDGKHLGSPAAGPPSATSGKPNPGKGHVKNQPPEDQPEPQSAEAPPTPPADAAAPGNSSQAPGQEDKAGKENQGGNGGNGHGK